LLTASASVLFPVPGNPEKIISFIASHFCS
jgi:hypothetical protein